MGMHRVVDQALEMEKRWAHGQALGMTQDELIDLEASCVKQWVETRTDRPVWMLMDDYLDVIAVVGTRAHPRFVPLTYLDHRIGLAVRVRSMARQLLMVALRPAYWILSWAHRRRSARG